MTESEELPQPIGDFIFDLHDATRRAQRLEEVQVLYEQKYKELSDKFYAQAAWPHPSTIISECNNDEVFLLFYKELTMRHLFAKLKQLPISIYMEAWSNYNKLFNFVVTAPPNFITITSQWAYEIIQEFVYQFQEFCQFRCHVAARSKDDIAVLTSNPDVWSTQAVSNILSLLITTAAQSSQLKSNTVVGMLGYFAVVESARMKCLLGDFAGSLKIISSHISLTDASEPFFAVTSCQVNLFYHAGVSMLMLWRYSDAIEIFTSLILKVSRLIKPKGEGNQRGPYNQFQKLMDKSLNLTCVCSALLPTYTLSSQVVDLINAKFAEKYKKLQAGDIPTFQETFEGACPKFVFGGVPDYSQPINYLNQALNTQVQIFATEVAQTLPALKLKSYLKLYSKIEISKLSRFMDMSEEEMTAILANSAERLKSRSSESLLEVKSTLAEDPSNKELMYHLEGNNLVIDHDPDSELLAKTQTFFKNGIKKSVECRKDLNRIFAQYGIRA